MTNALITGAKGFVGKHLEQHLVASGDVVTSVDRECDVTDLLSVRSLVERVQPDVLYHLAALTHVGESWTNQKQFVRVNVIGTKNVLDAVRETKSEATVVLVSSAEVYGVVTESDLPLHEDFRTAPANPYSASKLEAEHLALEAFRKNGVRVVIARPFNHIGPGQSTQFAVPAIASRLIAAHENHESEIRVGDLSTRRDFCDVRDVVRAYRLLAHFATTGEVYNVASSMNVAMSDVADWLRDEIAPEVSLTVDPALLRPVEIPVTRGSFQKIHDATGWEPEIALTRSLSDVVQDLRARRDRGEIIE